MPLPKHYPHIFRNKNEETDKAAREMELSREGRSSKGAYALLRADLNELFEYIEPEGTNFNTYSHRTYELFLRACTEVESNLKIIFDKNNARPASDNMIGYSDLEGPMQLSAIEVSCARFSFPPFRPFESFTHPNRNQRSPAWYRSYNSVKHNRAANFSAASLENVIKAVGAVYVMLDAQFGIGFGTNIPVRERDLVPHEEEIFWLNAIPKWQVQEQYAIGDWAALKSTGNPFDSCPIPVRP